MNTSKYPIFSHACSSQVTVDTLASAEQVFVVKIENITTCTAAYIARLGVAGLVK
jgi:SUMO ligase MMS21 Smc5/6 complex component